MTAPAQQRSKAGPIRKPLLRIGFAALIAAPVGVSANVLEISDEGEVTVYDRSPLTIRGAATAKTGEDLAAGADAFAAAARRHGLDADLLRAVAWTESRGNNSAISPKGAIGIMQLMPSTAAGLGVDPRDPIANIEGGAAYLARQLTTFGSVPLALAAYNAGPGAVMRYRGVPPYAETRAYVGGILRRLGSAAAVGPRPAPQRSVLPAAAMATPRVRAVPAMLIEVESP